jgi:hypothetical protein
MVMAENEQTKICPLCAETIRAAAKVCPHCRYWQKKWSLQNPQTTQSIGAFLMLLLITAAVVGLGIFLSHVIGPKRDFAPYRNQVKVVNSEVNFGMVYSNLTVFVVGVITNQSDYGWKQVGLEARFFDRNGKLIDVIPANSEYSPVTVLPHTEAGFKIQRSAAQEESAYASHQIFVRTAKDINAWP